MLPINPRLLTNVAAVVLCLTVGGALAQNDQSAGPQRQRGGRQRRGNSDPAQFQQRTMDRYRERLEITDDAEWKVIQPLIQNVLDARMSSGRGGFGRGGQRGREGNPTDSGQRRNPAPANPAAEELKRAIDTKATTPETKAALARYVAYRKGERADLEKAREALRAVLTSRQEAIAMLSGLL